MIYLTVGIANEARYNDDELDRVIEILKTAMDEAQYVCLEWFK